MDANFRRQELLVKMFKEAASIPDTYGEKLLPICTESLQLTFEENNNDTTKISPILVNVAQELKKLTDGEYNSPTKQGIAIRKGLRKNLFRDVNFPD